MHILVFLITATLLAQVFALTERHVRCFPLSFQLRGGGLMEEKQWYLRYNKVSQRQKNIKSAFLNICYQGSFADFQRVQHYFGTSTVSSMIFRAFYSKGDLSNAPKHENIQYDENAPLRGEIIPNLYHRFPKKPDISESFKVITGAPDISLDKSEQEVIKKFGFLRKRGMEDVSNWHLRNRGQWEDLGGLSEVPHVDTQRPIEEPPLPRLPLKHWDENRALSYDLRHFPLYNELFNQTVMDPAMCEVNSNLSPMQFQPGFRPPRDRLGRGYGDAKIFEEWPSWDPNFSLQVAEATDLILVPQSGDLYQKFYIGPLPLGWGWTLGSLIKSFAQHRTPGYAVVAIRLLDVSKNENVALETNIGENKELSLNELPNVREDILEIGLNLKQVAFVSKIPRRASRIRVRGEGPLRLLAGMIDWPSFVEVANPEQYICTVGKGEFAFDLKLEWGRGLWLADDKGLFREEEGFEYRCFKRRRILEVEEDGFYPNSADFGGCGIVRLAVHKLMGSRWCQERMECPDPKEQLSVEMWTSRKQTPKQLLLYSLLETWKNIKSAQAQLSEDTDWALEEKALTDSWADISAWGARVRQQLMQGGPPLEALDPVLNKNLAAQNRAESLPLVKPPTPNVDAARWLYEQLEKMPYPEDTYSNLEKTLLPDESEGSVSCAGRNGIDSICKENGDKNSLNSSISTDEKTASEQPADVFIDKLPISRSAKLNLFEHGIETLEDARFYSRDQLMKIPMVGSATVATLAMHLQQRFGLEFLRV